MCCCYTLSIKAKLEVRKVFVAVDRVMIHDTNRKGLSSKAKDIIDELLFGPFMHGYEWPYLS